MGRGPSTVLMLHGFPDSADVFRRQVRIHINYIGLNTRCCTARSMNASRGGKIKHDCGAYPTPAAAVATLPCQCMVQVMDIMLLLPNNSWLQIGTSYVKQLVCEIYVYRV